MSSSRLYLDARLQHPAEVPRITLQAKQKIWPGFTVSDDTINPDSKAYKKNIDSRWRDAMVLVYPSRDPQILTAVLEDLSVGLVVDFCAGYGSASMSAFNKDGEAVPVLSLVNNAEHQEHIEGNLSNHILRAMCTANHPIHSDEMEASVRAAFPNLVCLGDGTSDEPGSEAEEGAASEEEPDC